MQTNEIEETAGSKETCPMVKFIDTKRGTIKKIDVDDIPEASYQKLLQKDPKVTGDILEALFHEIVLPHRKHNYPGTIVKSEKAINKDNETMFFAVLEVPKFPESVKFQDNVICISLNE